jgi:Bacterial Ig domain
VKSRLAAGLLAVAVLAAVAVGFSGAAFTAGSANPGNDFATAASFSAVSLTDPGSPLRGTVAVNATTTGTIVSVKIQRSPAGAGTWTDICTDASSPYSCSFDTSGVADGLFDLRAIADDGTTTITSNTVANRRVDNTNPAVTMTDPGTPLSGTITLGATATDTGGSGVASVTIQRSPAGAGTWTDVCTDASSPYSCSFDTTAVGDGLYDFRAVSIDIAGNPNTSSTVTNRRVDNTAPTASLTDPGSPLRLTVTLTATSTDTGGSGVTNVAIERSPAGAGTWTNICTDASSPYSCSWNTTGVTDGSYDLRAIATDNAGNTATSTVTSRVVDNTAPTATNIDAANGGATVGTPESGDTVTFTYSETVLTSSILAGWNGTSTAVTVKFINAGASDQVEVWNAGTTAILPLTGAANVALNGNYVTASSTVTATMVQSGSNIVITLTATPASNRAGVGTMNWTPSATVTDIAGNACTTTAVNETGGAGADF